MRNVLCLVFCLATFVIVGAERTYSQKVQEGEGSDDDVRLPRLFSKFSPDDIFAAVFPDFDKATGRVPHIYNEEKQPSIVRLNQARLWRSGGKDFLVVMIDIGGYDERFGIPGLCGACTSVSPIAVLRAVNNRLELVAKQDGSFFQTGYDENHITGFEPFTYTGHDFHVSFDLAPYRLNDREMLIGLRYQHMWIPATSFCTTLLLYRIEGNQIRNVFEELVVDRNWENGPSPRIAMEKTTATIAMVPAEQGFNDLIATKKTYGCFATFDEMDCKQGRLVKTDHETWKFDGTIFVTTRKQEN